VFEEKLLYLYGYLMIERHPCSVYGKIRRVSFCLWIRILAKIIWKKTID